MAFPALTQENQFTLSTLLLFLTLVFIPLIFLILMNTHIRKIHKDINKLSQEIVKVSAKKANRLKKNEEEEK